MITISPVRRALVPADSAAADEVSARNYDEFQGDREVWEEIRERPRCILSVTMAHCAVERPDMILVQDSTAALSRAADNLRALVGSSLMRVVDDVLFVYEIRDPGRSEVRQIGLGGMARSEEIRTSEHPDGTIVRNEGVREEKARGRANLIRATDAFVGTVNHAVEDREGTLEDTLLAWADDHVPDFMAVDERGCTHRIWLVADRAAVGVFQGLLANEPLAYVADGNHRSAAAAMLGLPGYLAVFFPASTLGLAPYNRLVEGPRLPPHTLLPRLEQSFKVSLLHGVEAFQPRAVHEIGLYVEGAWYRLVPGFESFDPDNASEAVDADIVQRKLFDDILGITDARDDRLTFVGGDRDALYLKARVDSGEFTYAVTLAPVTMEQFVEVCRQGRMMPPKSTWFQPKLRMGLVVALLGGE